MALLLGLYWANGAVEVIHQVGNREDLAGRNAQWARLMPERGSRVIAPLRFVFDEIKNYEILGQAFYWVPRQGQCGALTVPGLFEDAKERNIAYVLVDGSLMEFCKLPRQEFVSKIGDYDRVAADGDFLLYALRSD